MQNNQMNNQMNNHQMNGGEKISEGGYGCVYYPSLRCDGTESTDKRYISKLQVNNYAGKNELRISDLIKKIPFYKDFFIPVISHCKVNSTVLKDGNIDVCEPLRLNNDRELIIMKMNYVKGDTLYNYLASIQDSKKFIHELIYTYNYLIESTALLLNKGIIHFDIKTLNIMYDVNKNTPFIIDFGLSFTIDELDDDEKLQKIFYVYAPDYYIWCPEIHLLSFIMNVTDSLSSDIISQVCREIVNQNKALIKIMSVKQLEQYVNNLTSFYIKKYKELDEDVDKFIKYLLSTYSTWDNYSVSIMFLKLLASIIDEDKRESSLFISLFGDMLIKSIHYNPDNRPDLMKLDEFLLMEMYMLPDIYKEKKSTTEKYINGFIDFLKKVELKHINIRKSIRRDEGEIMNISKSINRTIYESDE